jgi:hypothetical protein
MPENPIYRIVRDEMTRTFILLEFRGENTQGVEVRRWSEEFLIQMMCQWSGPIWKTNEAKS